ncbi:hypothetical protein [Saccharopolyspora sp. 5N708]|uniref:hypothetical protein n=1 Tax=Saccharopolyspora sp. 5N708 TaxID=3457424 RepID=UPI003FD16D14
MYRAFCFQNLAVTVEGIDFLDPNRATDSDVRERGVRIELRGLAEVADAGSIYASHPVRLGHGLCRFDLLESRPGAADRMHWHPMMTGGEPGQRVFDHALSQDPTGWLGDRLRDVAPLLRRAGLDPAEHADEVRAVARAAEEIVACVAAILGEARKPWPEVRRDVRGLVPIDA